MAKCLPCRGTAGTGAMVRCPEEPLQTLKFLYLWTSQSYLHDWVPKVWAQCEGKTQVFVFKGNFRVMVESLKASLVPV